MSRAATQSAWEKTLCGRNVGRREKRVKEEFKDRGNRTTGGPERDEFGGTVDEGPSRRTNCGSWERSWEVKGFIGQLERNSNVVYCKSDSSMSSEFN